MDVVEHLGANANGTEPCLRAMTSYPPRAEDAVKGRGARRAKRACP
jgi:hypothetical protein